MKKKVIFFGFSAFVMLFTLIAWQYAKIELAELQNSPTLTAEQEQHSNVF